MTDVSTLTAALPAQRRAALAVLLARRSASAFPVNEQPFNGCSFEQERLWLLRQLDAGDAVMPNATFGLRLWGTLDAGAMGAAFAAVVAHHEALRTVIDAGPSQRVLPTTGLAPLRVLDAAGNPERAAALTAEAAAERFDLATGPLCALTLIRLDEDDHALLFAGDHVALDEQSVAIVRRDLAAAYAAALAGRAWDPPAPAVRYRDYAAWSTARMSGEALHRRLEYWERILAEPRPLVGPSMTHGTAGTASVRTTLPAGGLDRLRAAGGPGTTPFVALLTALDVVLARLAGEPDVTVGTVYSARERAELEPLVGCFLNPLALRTDLAGADAFAEAAGRVRRAVTGAIANGAPFQHVVARLRDRTAVVRPFFRVTLAVHRHAEDLGAWPGIDAEVWHHEVGTDTLDLAVEAVPTPDGGAALTFRGPAGEHNTEALEDLAERFRALAAAVGADPSAPLFPAEPVRPCDLPTGPGPAGATVLEMFADRVAADPDAVAVDAGDATLTYAELDRASAGLAAVLRERGVARGDVVAVCLGRGAGLVTALLGVWRAGAAYLPLNPADPAARRDEVCQAAGVRHVVTDADVTPDGIEAVPPADLEPGDLAYVIFTSGSTGTPKGVAVPHAALAARVRWMTGAYGLSPADRVLQFAAATFDTHAEEVYPALAAGATLVMAPGDSAALPDFLATPAGAALTVLDLPTPYWHELVALGTALPWPDRLRLVIIGADQAQPHAVAAWRARFGDRVTLLNTYGPTEATVIATAARLGAADARRRPPIGRPIAETAAYVLDERLRPVPGGMPGELYLAGAGLARGYLGRPGATAQRFLPDPFGPPGTRMYRTGDRVRLGPDGELEFLGRTDNQLKIRGFRVEPGEAEARLQAHPLVRWAVVVPRAVDGEPRLVAYLIPAEDGAKDTAAVVRRDLAAALPTYLVPEAFVVLDAPPLTANGKVDVAALPDPGAPDIATQYTPPRTDGEELVAGVFAEVLGRDRIGVHDDFFAAGGHSLHAIRVVGRIRAATDLDVPVAALFERPTVAALTEHLEAMIAEDAAS
ncbi:amino acid adenylation domain-containing protein [Dactylosporangium darangshiense]